MSKLLQGKIVVFTGMLSIPRDEAKMMAERSGAIVTSTVTQATNVIVAGPGAGSKLAVAAAKGIETWTEQEFFQRMTREDLQGRLGDNSGQILEETLKK
jgi:DNA ligase (NAD+)